MEKTSVEWLIETFKLTNVDLSHHKLIIEQAKEIEKEYLIEFYIKGCEDTYGMDEGDNDRKDATNYYNKTFGGNND